MNAIHLVFLLLHLLAAEDCDVFDEAELMMVLREVGSYNPRYQAHSLEAAAVNFPDLTSAEAEEPEPQQAADRESCEEEVGARVMELQRKIGLDMDISKANEVCGHIDPRPTTLHPGLEYLKRSVKKKVLKGLQAKMSEIARRRRARRQIDEDPEHKVHIISCRAPNRQDNEGNIHLCGVCQAIRTLPDSYFPRFINQAICCPPDRCNFGHTCLRGHGICKQKNSTFDVLRNLGSEKCPRWHPMSIRVPVCCDCFLLQSSPLVELFQS